MYTPPAFREDDPAALAEIMRAAGLATLVTATVEGLVATPLPLIFVPGEGVHGTLYGHMARANPQASLAVAGEAMVLFQGPHGYVSPSWYASKAEHGKVVPTWNYAAVHCWGRLQVIDDADRLLDLVTRLTMQHEAGRASPWAVEDAPEAFVRAQLRGIVGLRLEISRIEGKRKMSQNRSAEDRAGVRAGLAAEADPAQQALAAEIPV